MSRERLAAAYDALAEASAQIAHELRANETPARGGTHAPASSAGVVPPSAPAERLPPSADKCPKHNKPFTQSKNPEWPNFCSSLTDDPAWGKPKVDKDGNPVLYCRITNRNAPEWVGLHQSAAAMDVDDVPF